MAMKEDPRMLINRYGNLQKGGPKFTSIPAIRKSKTAGLKRHPEMQQRAVSVTLCPDQATLCSLQTQEQLMLEKF